MTEIIAVTGYKYEGEIYDTEDLAKSARMKSEIQQNSPEYTYSTEEFDAICQFVESNLDQLRGIIDRRQASFSQPNYAPPPPGVFKR